jgi:PPOX class probable F420-dependent enzyme
MPVTIPDSYKDLLEGAVVVTLATVSGEGVPYAAPVWRRYDGEFIRITSDRRTRKVRNIQANPRVTVMAIDPKNPYRYLEIGGVVEQITADGALDELDRHTQLYMGQEHYFGGAEPVENASKYDGVLLVIRPTRVVTMG